MPVVEQCPQCGKSLGKIAFLSEVPECENCGSIFKDVGGTLSLVGDYGVDDTTITRQRVAADLSVFQHHLNNSRGMLESCKEQLTWGVERYAKLPPEPELLQLKDVPSLGQTLTQILAGAGILVASCVGLFVVAMVIGLVEVFVGEILAELHIIDKTSVHALTKFIERLFPFVLFGGGTLAVAIPLMSRFSANLANGSRPRENARRKRAHEQVIAAALTAAEPIKAAEDHRLRVRIQKLNRSIKTLEEKQENVRRILTTL